ncbi:hypothetical protein DAPPUDRAFT_197845, partial [Daphnia pulex]
MMEADCIVIRFSEKSSKNVGLFLMACLVAIPQFGNFENPPILPYSVLDTRVLIFIWNLFSARCNFPQSFIQPS